MAILGSIQNHPSWIPTPDDAKFMILIPGMSFFYQEDGRTEALPRHMPRPSQRATLVLRLGKCHRKRAKMAPTFWGCSFKFFSGSPSGMSKMFYQ